MITAHHSIDHTIRIVYIVDFLLGFRKAYLDERTGREIRDPWLITKKYLKGYFWVDLLSVIPFDLISDNGYLYCLQLVKIIRLYRLNQVITYMNTSAYIQGKIRLSYIVMRFFIIIHWTTCFFYSLTIKNYQSLAKADPELEWYYNYWIP